jgi:hypothetical protein
MRVAGSGWSIPANMTQGSRAVGGHLRIDGTVLRFHPHGLERLFRSAEFVRELQHLALVDIAPQTYHPFNGGLRKRLRVQFTDGTEALFVVNRPADVGQRIASAAQSAGGLPTVSL